MLSIIESLPLSLLEVKGPEAVDFLHRLTTQDIKSLQSGQVAAGALLDKQGKICFSGWFHKTQETVFIKTITPQADTAYTLLDKYLVAEDVELIPHKETFALGLYGPQLPALASELNWPWPETANSFTQDDNGTLFSRWDNLGFPALHILTSNKDILTSIQKTSPDLRPIEMEAFNTLRIEAGLPCPAAELTEDVILNELNNTDYVSFTKGCYIGQEIVARIEHRAHPPRLLTGFSASNASITKGAQIFSNATEVGVITSSCMGSDGTTGLALGFLKYGEEGPLRIQQDGQDLYLTISPLPFQTKTD